MGIAAASNWVIGFIPRMSSMVRSIEHVEYRVESTVLRRTYGLMA